MVLGCSPAYREEAFLSVPIAKDQPWQFVIMNRPVCSNCRLRGNRSILIKDSNRLNAFDRRCRMRVALLDRPTLLSLPSKGR